MSCAVEMVIAKKAIAEYTAATGAALADVRFQVWGFHPLLRVMVYLYFQRKAGTTDTAGSTWTATAIKRAGQGQQVSLQDIFADRDLSDGHEVASGAEGIEYTVDLGQFGTGSDAGTWFAEVVAMPAEVMDDALFCALADRLKLVVPSTVATGASGQT
jgi:hypothetical protein